MTERRSRVLISGPPNNMNESLVAYNILRAAVREIKHRKKACVHTRIALVHAGNTATHVCNNDRSPPQQTLAEHKVIEGEWR